MKAIRTTSLALLLLCGLRASYGQEGHDHAGPHGGTLAQSGTQHFEVVFAPTGLKVYPLSSDHKPVDASRLAGTATFYHPNAPDKPWFQKPLRPVVATPGQAPASLDLNVDLSTVPASGAKVAIEVAGLPTKTSFTVPVALAAASMAITVTKATQADQAAISAQKVCPVSHEDLTSMGGPLKISRGTQSIFLCCQSCVKAIKANPDKFFASRASAPATHDHKP